jgi:hypothetical protein
VTDMPIVARASAMALVAAALQMLPPLGAVGAPVDRTRPLEAHVWPYEGPAAPIVAGAADDFWTASGTHYRIDGTVLGKLTFSPSRGPLPTVTSLEVAREGQVFATALWPGIGPCVSGHDREGRQLWVRPLGRPSSAAPSEVVRRPGQGAPRSQVTAADIAGIDRDGTVRVSGWIQGCVDLAPAPASHVECATLTHAGKNLDSVDAFPQLLFLTSFDSHGEWKESRAFWNLPAQRVVGSSQTGALAVTADGWWKKALSFQPSGARPISVPFSADEPPSRSVALVVGSSGKLEVALHLSALAGQTVQSLAFDAKGTLWLLVTSFPGLEIRGLGVDRSGASDATCISLVSVDGASKRSHVHATRCRSTEGRSGPAPGVLTTAADGRVVISGATLGLAAGDVLESPAGLDRAPAARDACAGARAPREGPYLTVTRAGNPDWSVQMSVVNAVGVADGWTCFASDSRLGCLRPKNASPLNGSQSPPQPRGN